MAIDTQRSLRKSRAARPPRERVDQPTRTEVDAKGGSTTRFGVVLNVPAGYADERVYVEVGVLTLAEDFETSGLFRFMRDSAGAVDLVPAFCMPGLTGKHYEAIRWKGDTAAWDPAMIARRLFTVEGVLFIEHDYWEDLGGPIDEAFLVPDDCQLPIVGGG